MTAAERGFLLLCCDLGEPDRKPLTAAQLRQLRRRLRFSPAPPTPDDQVTEQNLMALGIDRPLARQIAALMNREAALEQYLLLARQEGVAVITCVSESYPRRLSEALGDDAPAVLFCRGELSLLGCRCVSLVGSRRLKPDNRAFAQRIGTLAAGENLVLVSGNAEGADRAAQDACLDAGGAVIAFVPDRLAGQPVGKRQLLISEDGFHLGFSAARALRRNAFIHAMGQKTFVAQSDYGHGGTWAGTMDNLRRGWSEVYVFNDGSEAAAALAGCGAAMTDGAIASILGTKPDQMKLF